MPVDVFAIRTTAKNPRKNQARTTGSWGPNVERQRTNSPPLGEGDYASPDAGIARWQENEEQGDKEVTARYAEAETFLDPEFPVALVKPRVIESASRARTLRIFDEIGVLPAPRHRRGNRLGGADPLIVGSVVIRHSAFSEKRLSFLIHWWVDKDDF